MRCVLLTPHAGHRPLLVAPHPHAAFGSRVEQPRIPRVSGSRVQTPRVSRLCGRRVPYGIVPPTLQYQKVRGRDRTCTFPAPDMMSEFLQVNHCLGLAPTELRVL